MARMSLDLVDSIPSEQIASRLGATRAWLVGAMSGGRALVMAHPTRPRSTGKAAGLDEVMAVVDGRARVTVLDRTPMLLESGSVRVTSDGERIARVSRAGVTIWTDPKERPRRFTLTPPKKERLEVVDAFLVRGADMIWVTWSDAFHVAEGRYVTCVWLDGKRVRQSAPSQPFPWRPYAHSTTLLRGIGAAREKSAHVYGSGLSGTITEVGSGRRRSVRAPAGTAAFDVMGRSVAIVDPKAKRVCVIDSNGETLERIAISHPRYRRAFRLDRYTHVRLAHRELWLDDSQSLTLLRLSAEPPAFRSETTTTSEKNLPESVRGWNLNQTPAFDDTAPITELVIERDVLVFRKNGKNGRARFAFDFLLKAILKIAITKPPRGAKAARDVVMMTIHTPSGMTRVLCRKPFAGKVRAAAIAAGA